MTRKTFEVTAICFIFLLWNVLPLHARTAIIPTPTQFTEIPGQFKIPAEPIIYYDRVDLAETAKVLSELVHIPDTVIPILETDSIPDKRSFSLSQITDASLGTEGYLLEISKDRVIIQAQTSAGIFYGIQTIRQLLPVTLENKADLRSQDLVLPCLSIRDTPRYPWRGYMLDESRHFMGKRQVKKILDIMAFYKLNRFHWHLTDVPGWRIEIKKYPKLTTVGGRGDLSSPENPVRFYTQEDIKEVVQYARERHIVVIPEIDMPGHATAANLAYPEYSGGGSKRHPEFTFNPGKEATYRYLEDILKEVAALFPSPWIHYGGDEVHFANKQWADLPEVQALQKKYRLEGLKEVEYYFNRRMAEVIDGLDRTTIGWDEVTDAGLDKDKTVVMWWRHNMPEQRDKAIKRGFQVILCPRIPCYFDFVQHQSHQYGRRWDGFSDLRGMYEYPTLPQTYTAEEHKRILGIQANLWTERVHTVKRMNFMTFPRLSALAEAAWTEEYRKSYECYLTRLKTHFKRYEVWGLYYFNPFDPTATPEPAQPEVEG